MDLFYRLATFKISVPPLRKRLEDIPAILDNLLKRYHLDSSFIREDILQCLAKHSWPGNIRELLGVMENYLVLLNKKEHDKDFLEQIILEQEMDNINCEDFQIPVDNEHDRNISAFVPANNEDKGTLKNIVDKIKKDIIEKEISKFNGNKRQAAYSLGIGYSSLCRLLNN